MVNLYTNMTIEWLSVTLVYMYGFNVQMYAYIIQLR